MRIWHVVIARFFAFWREVLQNAERYQCIRITVERITRWEAIQYNVDHGTKIALAKPIEHTDLQGVPRAFQEKLATVLARLYDMPITADTIQDVGTVTGIIVYIFDHDHTYRAYES